MKKEFMPSWIAGKKWYVQIALVILLPFAFVATVISVAFILLLVLLAAPFFMVIGIRGHRKYLRDLAKNNRLVDWATAKQMAMDGECMLFFEMTHHGRGHLWSVRRTVLDTFPEGTLADWPRNKDEFRDFYGMKWDYDRVGNLMNQSSFVTIKRRELRELLKMLPLPWVRAVLYDGVYSSNVI